MQAPDNEVEMQLWYSSSNVKALNFLKEFDMLYSEEIDRYLSFKPKFVTWNCNACSEDFKKKECFGDGEYCAPNDGRNNAYEHGSDIILEDLREMCLFDQMTSQRQVYKWWHYMNYVHQSCYDFITEDCSRIAHEEIGEDYKKTLQCVKSSFKGGQIDWKAEN